MDVEQWRHWNDVIIWSDSTVVVRALRDWLLENQGDTDDDHHG